MQHSTSWKKRQDFETFLWRFKLRTQNRAAFDNQTSGSKNVKNHRQPALYWRTNFWSTQNFTTIGVAYFWVLFPQLEDQVTYSIFWQNSLEQLRLCVIHAFRKILWGGVKSYRCERIASKKAFPDVLCFISQTATSCCTLMHPVWLHHTPETP